MGKGNAASGYGERHKLRADAKESSGQPRTIAKPVATPAVAHEGIVEKMVSPTAAAVKRLRMQQVRNEAFAQRRMGRSATEDFNISLYVLFLRWCYIHNVCDANYVVSMC